MDNSEFSKKRYFRYYTYIKPIFKIKALQLYGSYTLTIIATAFFIYFAIKPTIETILVLQKELADSELVLAQITQKSEDIALASKNYALLDPLVKQKITAAIPDQPEIKSLVLNLEKSAISASASISAIQFEPITISPSSETASTSATIAFNFNTEGNYEALLEVLDGLMRSPRIISIDNLIMNKTTETGSIVMSVKGVASYLK